MKPALRQMNFSLHSFDGHAGSTDKEGYICSVLSYVKEAVQKTGMIISLRLWNLDTDNATNQQRNRNREILEIIEREFHLPYRIEEKIRARQRIENCRPYLFESGS